jgi:alpha-L-rhamnosidase
VRRAAPVSPSDFPEIRWHTHWIWTAEYEVNAGIGFPGEGRGSRKKSNALFRKMFRLDNVPARAPARMTADSRYAVYVNGRVVSRGPARSQPRRMQYDLFDLAPYLKQGDNTLAVFVRFYGRTTAFYAPPASNNGLGKTGAPVFEAGLGAAG